MDSLQQDKHYQKMIRKLAQESEIDFCDRESVKRAQQELLAKGPEAQKKLRKEVAAIWERYERDMQTAG